MISREDVLKVAYDLKKLPISEKDIAYCIVEYDRMADQDPTGYWEVWVEQLLEECEPFNDTKHSDEFIDNIINDLFECIKTEYQSADNEVCGGEFILTLQVPTHNSDNQKFTLYIVQSAIAMFLEWDGSNAIVGTYLDNDNWLVEEFDSVSYNNVEYPVRVLTVTIDEDEDDWVRTYKVAPESLYDKMIETEGEDCTTDFGSMASRTDENIYYYIEDSIFYESAEYIAKNGLDTPMTIVEVDK